MRAFAITGIVTAAWICSIDRGVAHARHAPVTANIRGNPLKGHDRDGARVFSDLRLLGIDDVHDDPAAEHVGESTLDERGTGN